MDLKFDLFSLKKHKCISFYFKYLHLWFWLCYSWYFDKISSTSEKKYQEAF
jgi:hypothetical protein